MILLTFFSFFTVIVFPKPDPCHEIKAYKLESKILKIILERKEGLCPQVIVKDRIDIKEDVKTIEELHIYLKDKLWRIEHLRRDK